MACARDRGGCIHDHDDHRHGGRDETSPHATRQGAGCCGGRAVKYEDDDAKPAERS